MGAFRTELERFVCLRSRLGRRGTRLGRLLARGGRRMEQLRGDQGRLRMECAGLGVTEAVDVRSGSVGSAGRQLSELIHRISGYVTLLGRWGGLSGGAVML